MLTTTGYFCDFRVFHILAILAAIFAVLCSFAITNAMRAFLVLCHITHPAFSVQFAFNYIRVAMEHRNDYG